MVSSVTNCKEFAAPGLVSAEWRCTLTLPNSFAPEEGHRVVVTGESPSKDAASELACQRAVVSLISESPNDFLLRPGHWTVSPDQLVANLPGADAGHQALPVHAPVRVGEAGAAVASLPEDQVSERVTDIIKQCLRAHGGSFDPSQISHKLLGLSPCEERMHARLNKLLQPGQLRQFLDRHPEFAWQQKGPRGMVVTWAAHGCALSAAAAPNSASAAVGGAAASAGGQQVEQHEVVLRRQALPRVWRQALPPLQWSRRILGTSSSEARQGLQRVPPRAG